MSNITLFVFIALNFLSNIVLAEQAVKIECSNKSSMITAMSLCYHDLNNSFSWIDAYDECLSKTNDGLPLQIVSPEKFTFLKDLYNNETTLVWLGANNLASSNWRWYDGSVVDNSIVNWCPNSTYKTAVGTYCAAYDSTLQCVNNYLCNTLLSVLCVSVNNGMYQQPRQSLLLQSKVIYLCGNGGSGYFVNWWTYSVLLLNWFMLFCFFLYLSTRFVLNKSTVILTSIILILSFILILIYAILWGIQYQDIIQIPLAIVILGSIANALLFMALLMVLNDRNRVKRFVACMILTYSTIVLESFFMLGLILCIAHCSAYIVLSWTNLDKDIIASILSSLTASISVLFSTGILHLLESDGYDRVPAAKRNEVNLAPSVQTQPTLMASRALPHPSPTNSQVHHPTKTPIKPLKKNELVERATSPIDERIIDEFYNDRPKDVHAYDLEGKHYIVYEGIQKLDVESYRKDLIQAMLLQEPEGLNEAINRAKSSIFASNLADDISQAQELAAKLTSV